ncbi:cupin domain-containing protein [Nitratireductor sp. XY-223]|uniref:cupin domain-containing protein n=1 Tax=Nitratireductor sp. XY-223 TaxID=2561926 RepID=UPI0010A9ECBE|nr:cupin domain-containing protein [Nitratireductor sp. XY-223]
MNFVDQDDVPWIEGEGYRKKILLRDDALNAKGTLVQIVELAPHARVEDHHHESCTEVFHVMRGQGTFEIDGRVFELRPGDTLTCEPGEVHNTRNPHSEPFTYIVFKTNVVDNDLFWEPRSPRNGEHG